MVVNKVLYYFDTLFGLRENERRENERILECSLWECIRPWSWLSNGNRQNIHNYISQSFSFYTQFLFLHNLLYQLSWLRDNIKNKKTKEDTKTYIGKTSAEMLQKINQSVTLQRLLSNSVKPFLWSNHFYYLPIADFNLHAPTPFSASSHWKLYEIEQTKISKKKKKNWEGKKLQPEAESNLLYFYHLHSSVHISSNLQKRQLRICPKSKL